MPTIIEQIREEAARLQEGTPLTARALLHLGGRAAIDQALSRLWRRGELLRIGRGLYVRPVTSRFGSRPPFATKVVEAIAFSQGETIVPHGAAAANAFGLTTQVPVREVYLTTGRTRRLTLGAHVVELRHAPAWQLVLPGRPAGDVVRVLAWLGPRRAMRALQTLWNTLPQTERRAITATRGRLPTWMAEQVSAFSRHV